MSSPSDQWGHVKEGTQVNYKDPVATQEGKTVISEAVVTIKGEHEGSFTSNSRDRGIPSRPYE